MLLIFSIVTSLIISLLTAVLFSHPGICCKVASSIVSSLLFFASVSVLGSTIRDAGYVGDPRIDRCEDELDSSHLIQ